MPKPMEMKWAEKSAGVSFDESGKHCSRDTEGSFEHAVCDLGFTYGHFKWTFVVKKTTSGTLIGITTKPCKKSSFTEPNYTLWNCYNGELYINGKRTKVIEKVKPGDKITFAYDGTRGNCVLFKNGKQCSDGFQGIRDKIFPCVCFYGPCDTRPTVEILGCEQE